MLQLCLVFARQGEYKAAKEAACSLGHWASFKADVAEVELGSTAVSCTQFCCIRTALTRNRSSFRTSWEMPWATSSWRTRSESFLLGESMFDEEPSDFIGRPRPYSASSAS